MGLLGQYDISANVVARETLLPWQQQHNVVTSLFNGAGRPYLVSEFVRVIQFLRICGYQGDIVTMATAAYCCNFSI